MALLCEEVRAACLALAPEEWRRDVASACRRHPLHKLLLEDPYTRRAFEKPRGYAGDAVMLDYVYAGDAPPGTSHLGRQVFQATACSPNGRSVVMRRDRIAALIGRVAEDIEKPTILSLGCGHLREAQRARLPHTGWGGRFHALDQDGESLAVVEREQGGQGVRAVHSSVGPLLRGQAQFAGLHLVYAAGLFDYLNQALAARLLRLMYRMLVPHGRLLVANFTPDSHGRGYMEAFMDWWLIYRDEAAMEALIDDAVGDAGAATRSMFRDAEGNVIYFELTKCA
jgi:extracellular factor (EF) 3-hydroxypalmitic acid methyl ester biosynthesis protein